MALQACDDWDEGVRDMLKVFAPLLKEDYKECPVCGCPHLTNRENKSDLCIECLAPQVQEARKERQKTYKRYYKVKEDRRRKEFKYSTG